MSSQAIFKSLSGKKRTKTDAQNSFLGIFGPKESQGFKTLSSSPIPKYQWNIGQVPQGDISAISSKSLHTL